MSIGKGEKNLKVIDRVLSLIEKQGITKYKLSIETGISQGLIGDWAAGRKEPSLKNSLKIAEYFNVSLDYLVGRTENPKVNK
jgi:transcriptional regulator with XRE-family HTH domain